MVRSQRPAVDLAGLTIDRTSDDGPGGRCQAVWNRLAGLLIQTSMGSRGEIGRLLKRAGLACQAASRMDCRVCWTSIQVPSKTECGVCQAMPL